MEGSTRMRRDPNAPARAEATISRSCLMPSAPDGVWPTSFSQRSISADWSKKTSTPVLSSLIGSTVFVVSIQRIHSSPVGRCFGSAIQVQVSPPPTT